MFFEKMFDSIFANVTVWFWGPCNGKVILFCDTNQTHPPLLLFFFWLKGLSSESKITELERAFRCHLAQPPVTVSCIVCRPSFCRSFSEILIVCDDPLRSNFLTIYFLTDFFFFFSNNSFIRRMVTSTFTFFRESENLRHLTLALSGKSFNSLLLWAEWVTFRGFARATFWNPSNIRTFVQAIIYRVKLVKTESHLKRKKKKKCSD